MGTDVSLYESCKYALKECNGAMECEFATLSAQRRHCVAVGTGNNEKRASMGTRHLRWAIPKNRKRNGPKTENKPPQKYKIRLPKNANHGILHNRHGLQKDLKWTICLELLIQS